MSFDGSRGEGNGVETREFITSPSTSAEQSTGKMKRSAARQRIERYYFQLKEGCGKPDCDNPNCASSSSFGFTNISNNDAGLKAIDLFKANAKLCDSKPSKVARNGSEGEGCSSSVSAEIRTATSQNEPSTSSDPKPLLVQTPTAGMDTTMNPPRTPNVEPAVASSSHQLEANQTVERDVMSEEIVDTTSLDSSQSLSLAQALAQLLPPPSSREKTSSSPPKAKADVPFLTEEKLTTIVRECKEAGCWSQLIRAIGSIFNNPESLVKSFRKVPASKEEIRAMEVDPDKDTDDIEETETEENEKETLTNVKDDELSLDIDALRRAYKEMFSVDDPPFQSALINALMYLSRDMDMEMKYHKPYEKDPNFLNIFMIVLEIPHIFYPEYLDSATAAFCKVVGQLPQAAQAKLVRVWSTFSREWLKDMLHGLQQLITVKCITTEWSRDYIVNSESSITGATTLIKLVYYACLLMGQQDPPAIVEAEQALHSEMEANISQLYQGAVGRDKERVQPRQEPLAHELGIDPLNCRQPLIDWEDFINEPLSDVIEMDKDYTNYKAEKVERFTFMTHPFMLTTAAKHMGLYFDNRIRMLEERRSSFLQSFLHGSMSMPHFRLRIRRDHIIDDALVNLEMAAMDNPGELKKQLYVEFEGEQGIDEGGVSKEFFQLVIEELFNPDIGMFTYDEETHSFWFNPMCFENDGQFTLIGIMLGLAIYNNVILDVHFPMVIYRKLLGKLGTFDDLTDSHPTLARSLQDLLGYEGDVEDTFAQSFQISYNDVFGDVLTHNLKPEGDQVMVTNENRKEYVDLYADFLLNKSIEKQFKAFYRGFTMVTDESPIRQLFLPHEIELLVCGSKKFDFQALEDTTEYDGGFTESSPVIKYFWEVVHEFDEEQKRKLLQFTTGSDRVPVGGLSKIKLIIAKNGPDSDRLPTAHTCFNVLLLPNYNSKDKLQERLLKAIHYAKGFGML